MSADLILLGWFDEELIGGAHVPTTYTQPLTASLSFTGAVSKTLSRALTAALSFTGALSAQHLIIKALTAALSFTGAQVKSTIRALPGGLSFTGAVSKQTRRALTGGLSFAGVLSKPLSRALAATLNFTGALTASHLVIKLLTAALSFTGAQAKTTSRSLAGVLSFTGAVPKQTLRALSGVLSFTGALPKQSGKAFSSALSFTGAQARRTSKIFSGVLSFTGAQFRSVQRALSGVLSFTGVQVKRARRSLAAALSFIGALNTGGSTHYTQVLTAVLSFTGAQAKTTSRALIAVLSFTGATTRRVSRPLTAALSFAGLLTPSRLFVRALTAALSFAGTTSNRAGKTLSATLSFTGTQARRTQRAFAAALSFTGTLNKQATRLFTAALSFTGLLTPSRLFVRALTAALSFTGAFAKRDNKAFTATLSFTGAQSKRVVRAYTATLSFTGAIARRIPKALTAALSFTGVFTGNKINAIVAGVLLKYLIVRERLRDYSTKSVPRLFAIARSLANSVPQRNLGVAINFAQFSEQFDNALWQKVSSGGATAPIVTSNAGLSPFGELTADRVQFFLNGSNTTGDICNLQQAFAYTGAPDTTFGVWLKSNNGLSQSCAIFNVNGQGATLTVTPNWQFFTRTISSGFSGGSSFGVRTRGGQSMTDAADLLVWGAQLQNATLLGPYARTLNAPYNGPDPHLYPNLSNRDYSIISVPRLFAVFRTLTRSYLISYPSRSVFMAKLVPTKAPTEVIPLTFDFSPDLAPGATIVGGTPALTAVVEADGSGGTDNSPSAILLSTPTLSGSVVQQMIQNGVDLVDYRISCTITDTNGNKWTLQAILPVRAKI